MDANELDDSQFHNTVLEIQAELKYIADLLLNNKDGSPTPRPSTDNSDEVRASREAAKANRDLGNSTRELTAYEKAQAKALGENTDSLDRNSEANRKARETKDNYRSSLNSAINSVNSFGKALLDSKPGFDKYGQSISGLGDAAVSLGKNFGIVGAAAGYLVKGFTKVAELSLKQADNTLKFTDDLSKLGAVNSFSAEELRKLASQAGFASGDLEKLSAPIKTLGSTFKQIGSGAEDSTRKFMQMADVGPKVRQEFQRLGYSQAELVEAQAGYIDLMGKSGGSLRAFGNSAETLKKVSLDYVKNLQVLSEISGKTAKEQQDDMARAAADMEFQIYMADMNKKIAQASTDEEKMRLEEQKQLTLATKAMLADTQGEDVARQFGQRVAGGPGTVGYEITAVTGNQKLVDELVNRSLTNTQTQVGMEEAQRIGSQRALDTATGPMRQAIIAGGEEVAKLVGGVKVINRANQLTGKEDVAAATQAKIDANEAGTGPAALDPAQQARNALTEAEIKARTTVDDLIASMNPLMNGFNNTTLTAGLAGAALLGLAMAAGEALKELTRSRFDDSGSRGRGRGRGARASMDRARRIAGGSRGLGGAARGAGGLLGRGAGALAGAATGGLLTAGMIGKDVYDVAASDGPAKKEDKYGAAGGAAGAAIGGGIGLLFGGVGAVPGAAIGGFLGNTLGNWYGSTKDQEELTKKNKQNAEAQAKAAATATQPTAVVPKPTTPAAAAVVPKPTTPAAAPAVKPTTPPVTAKPTTPPVTAKPTTPAAAVVPKPTTPAAAVVPKPTTPAAAVVPKPTTPVAAVVPKPTTPVAAVVPKPTTPVAPLASVTPSLTQRTETPVPVKVINTDDLAKALQQKTSVYRRQVLPNIVSPQRNVDNRRPLPENQQYTVKQGDTLNSIGQQFKTTIEELINNNPNLTQKNWKEGLELSVPKPDTTKLDVSSGAKLSQQIQSEVLEKVFGNMQRIYKTGTTPLTNMQQPDKDKKQLNLYQKQLEENRTLYAPVLEENTNLLKNQRAEYDFLSRSTGLFKKNMDESAESFIMLIKANKELYEVITGRKYDEDKAKTKNTTTESAPTSETGGQPVTGMPSGVPQNVEGNLNLVAKALREKGFGDENYINAVLGNVLKESGGKMDAVEKIDYSNTSNNRIRDIFKSKTRGMSDQDLTALKEDPQAFANKMYEGTAGNKQPNDGWTFRGRGPIQLTGRGNYAKASKEIFGDDRLVKNPDLVLDPTVGAEVVAWYMEDTHKGMRKKFGFDKNQMLSKQEAALLATSQIAGQKITPGQGYLGTENLGKVQSYAQNLPTGMGTQATANYQSGSSGSGESDSAGLKGAMKEKGLGKLSANKPDNVKVGPKTDISNMDSKLLTGFYSAAKEYGGPVTVNSAFRDDQYQGELWVRGRILGEKGIHTPAPPKNDVKITYGGKTYDVPGSGKGSKHREGEALDISADFGSLDPLLSKYGLHRPFKANDPPHVQLKAEKGGLFKGPDSGYPVELHGTEMVVPMDNRFTRSTSSSNYTVNGKDVSKKDYDTFMNTNPMLKNMQNKSETLMNSLSSSNKDIFNNMSSMSSNFKNDISGIKEEIINKNNFVDNTVKDIVDRELQRISQATTDTNAPMTNMVMDMKTNMNQMMRSYNNSIQELSGKMGQLVDAINDGNSTRNKILRKTI